MGYGIVLVMKKSFEDSGSFEGRVAYARKFEELTKDFIKEPEGNRYCETFNKGDDYVALRDKKDISTWLSIRI